MVELRRGPWAPAEDRMLIELVQRKGPHNWVRISHEIETRTPKQCRERYHQNLKPNLNHNPITQEEGEIIVRLVSEIGKKWAEIARRLPGRSDNAVKNWWNGGVHRRRRNNERQAQHHIQPSPASHPPHPHQPYQYPPPSHHQLEHPSPAHAYPAPPHHSPHAAHPPPSLPPIRSYADPAMYPESRRPSLNPSLDSPRSLKLPHPPGLEAYPGSRPPPLQLAPLPYSASRNRTYETPIPSPGFSIASADAPSLMTDTGSDTRSPRGALSPSRNSAPYDHYRRRSSVQLPPIRQLDGLDRAEERPLAPAQARSLASPWTPTYLAKQQPLPPHEPLSLPPPRKLSPAALLSPTFRELPLPPLSGHRAGQSSSAPASPRDQRMNINNLL